MPQEISISQQAVKARIYKLIDALVEGTKTEHEVQESIMRWWNLVHPEDRPMARKYVLALLQRANASLTAVSDGLMASQNFQQTMHDPMVAKARSASPRETIN
jgi:hypothetical protein